MTETSSPATDAICSSKGCRALAVHVLVWNNPRLHTPEREKCWAACDEHRDSLGAFLDARGFLRRIEPRGRNAPDRNAPDRDGVSPA